MASGLLDHCIKMERARPVAIFDPDAETLAAKCAQYGAEPVQDIEALARWDVDCYLVGSPPLAHHANVLALAPTGRPIYSEKPLTTTAKLCDEMIEACRKSGSKLFVGQVLRLFSLFWKSREIVESGVIGAPQAISIVRSGRGDVFSYGWRTRFQDTGGLLLEVNSHELDYMLSLMGPAKWALAQGANLNRWGDYEDSLFVQIGFERGGMGQLHSSNSSPIGEYQVSLQCERGNMVHGGFRGELRWQAFDSEAPTVLTAEDFKDRKDPYQIELESFFDWVEKDAAPLFTGETGRANVAVADAAYKSLRTRKPEPVMNAPASGS
jgi:predicted dehydrogenase